MTATCRLQRTCLLCTARTAQRLIWRSCLLCTAKGRPCLAAGSSCRHRTECRWCCWRRRWRESNGLSRMLQVRWPTRCSCWACRIACRSLQALVHTSSRFGKCSQQRSDSRRISNRQSKSSWGWRCTAGCSRWRCRGRGSSARGQIRWRTCPPRSTRTRLGRRKRWLCRDRRGRMLCSRRWSSGRRGTANESQQRCRRRRPCPLCKA